MIHPKKQIHNVEEMRRSVNSRNVERFLTKTSLSRTPSPIRALVPYLSREGMISLGGGMPNVDTFPIASVELKLKGNDGALVLDEDETKKALQYSPSYGLPSLVAHLKRLQQDVHYVHFSDGHHDIIVTNGSQDGLTKAFEMLLTPDQDTLLIESPTYSGSLAFLGPLGVNLKGVSTDSGGMIPSELRRVLDNWDSENKGRRKPRVLYTIPTGSNPTGGSLSLERKNEIYDICVQVSCSSEQAEKKHAIQEDETASEGMKSSYMGWITKGFSS